MKNMSPLTQNGIDAVLKAGEILKKGFGSITKKTIKTGNHNFATQYDYAAEKCIIGTLLESDPTYAFLAEESGVTHAGNGEITWIIDPLDGTLNFAHHIPIFCISAAAAGPEGLLSGIIYQPMTQELFIAEKGKGAYLNGKKLYVSKTKRVVESLTATKFPRETQLDFENCLTKFYRVLEKGTVVRNTGSSALNLSYVAAGGFDAYWASSLSSWDIAAGVLLIQEAGGQVATYEGNFYDLFSGAPLLATNGHLHQEMLALLK